MYIPEILHYIMFWLNTHFPVIIKHGVIISLLMVRVGRQWYTHGKSGGGSGILTVTVGAAVVAPLLVLMAGLT